MKDLTGGYAGGLYGLALLAWSRRSCAPFPSHPEPRSVGRGDTRRRSRRIDPTSPWDPAQAMPREGPALGDAGVSSMNFSLESSVIERTLRGSLEARHTP